MPSSRDLEMADLRPKEDSFAQGSVLSMQNASSYSRNSSSNEQDGHPIRRWLDSFRRDPGRHVTPASVMHTAEDRRRASMATRRSEDTRPSLERRGRSRSHYFDMHAANVGTANTLLSRELKGRHLQMIAIGGSIGMSFASLSLFLSPYFADAVPPTTPTPWTHVSPG
jgi:amino acid transporter